ncbi:MAG: 7-carboxy-7-deazaguanine synthase QueE [Dysgonamonadaceae bacterium]|jgi:organic radical activating enzyme|nr:7-carboxy-7-deazaguanine synthase QueE [Dysgonamonadaceae bacterium]
MKLKVNEWFYSIQGEGGRSGEASIFIRLAGCNLRCDFCDTDFGLKATLDATELYDRIREYPCKWIVWTGGEPMLQLTDDILLFFINKGYKQAVESNGCFPISPLFDYTVCSPKGKPDYARSINPEVTEVRLPVKQGDLIPDIKRLPKAFFYFLSPVFDDTDDCQTKKNIDYCTAEIKKRPEWRLSLQIHKLIGIR